MVTELALYFFSNAHFLIYSDLGPPEAANDARFVYIRNESEMTEGKEKLFQTLKIEKCIVAFTYSLLELTLHFSCSFKRIDAALAGLK